jgi:photosystem II stability/assembly factor-like uncharacterized protein
MRALIPLLILSIVAAPLSAQSLNWAPQDSGTTASLRGIYSVDGQVAWAGGTEATILRTVDGGAHWERCAAPGAGDPPPKKGEALDFRGIHAWDANTAEAMSAGPGELSRIYKTTDGCKTWKLELMERDKHGFWDAMVYQAADFGLPGDLNTGVLIGDPVRGQFETKNMLQGNGWYDDGYGCAASEEQSAFAASNSSAFLFGSRRYILGTGGAGGARVYIAPLLFSGLGSNPCRAIKVPMAGGKDSSGIFSLSFRSLKIGVAVGGDYKKPKQAQGTAAWTADMGLHWTAAETPPHGYRSSVAWSAELSAWIAVGTNGSDLSRDDGKTWTPLDDGTWNALSLPFVVGPEGRIARISALTAQ